MNERIRELAHQADLVIKKSNGNDFRFGAMDPKLEKFAKLIVKECAELVDNDDSSYPYDSFGHKLKQHFGVE